MNLEAHMGLSQWVNSNMDVELITLKCQRAKYGILSQNFDFNLRRDPRINFLWELRLWVGRRKEPTLGYIPKTYEKNSGSGGLKSKCKCKVCRRRSPHQPSLISGSKEYINLSLTTQIWKKLTINFEIQNYQMVCLKYWIISFRSIGQDLRIHD